MQKFKIGYVPRKAGTGSKLILSAPMLDVLSSQSALSALDGTDCRNYGCLDGIPEAKELMGLPFRGCRPKT